AMRYTEIRMQKISHEMLADLDKETVDWVPNYDGTEQIPAVLPTKIPSLLVNGSSGIAVGMATNIPPHNLTEVVNGCLALLDNPDISIDELMEHIPGPDFPTAAIINGRAGIVDAYRTGRGRIYVRSRAEVISNEKTNKDTIVITELPYQVNKARLIEKIAELVKDKKIEGIAELRDESDKDGLRVVIEMKRGESGEVVLNNLYAQTQLQNVFGINIVALVDNQPRILNLKELLEYFVRHRREVVTRRTVYLLRKARERGHVLEGLAVAISNIDEVIATIKASATTQEAKENLISRGWALGEVSAMLERAGEDACRPDELEEQYGVRDGNYWLSPAQVQAILELRLQKLTGLEHEKLLAEYQEKLAEIAEYLSILADPQVLLNVIRGELEQVVADFGDERRTEIVASQLDLTHEDLIPEEDRVVTISHGGYAKSQPLDAYAAQRRGGMGKSATAVKEEDFVEHLLVANTHDTILCFSNIGKVYWLKVYQIPVAGRNSRGRPMVNLLPLGEDERITSILPVHEYTEGYFIFMATANGTVKKTPLEAFSRPRSVGLIALALDEGDVLIGTEITDGSNDVMLLTSGGKAARFAEGDVRAMGRTARGVRGVRMDEDQQVIAMIIPKTGGRVLTVSENGYGKRTDVEDFPCKGRGNRGVIAMTMSDRNGALVGAVQVFDGDDLMLITDQGTLVRTRTDEISLLSRNTQGVKVIRLRDDEHLVGVQRVAEQDVDDVVDDVELSAEAPAGEAPAADDADNDSPAAE
ncbi:MAG: DNA gyrase subunit A, partial [Spongiibacter marinus]|uniref:DNA gyrase subunit A n=1 Tax=Spongiibacter marinus TaxID=354246 RepID=UPI003C330B3C